MDINKVKINGKEFTRCFTNFYYSNEFRYASTPTRVIDGTLETDCVDSYYVPRCEFSFSVLSPSEYSYLVQALNGPGCIVECYDYELMKDVRRFMCMAKIDRNKLIASGGKLERLMNSKFSMESKYAYLDYSELSVLATNDTRF